MTQCNAILMAFLVGFILKITTGSMYLIWAGSVVTPLEFGSQSRCEDPSKQPRDYLSVPSQTVATLSPLFVCVPKHIEV